MNRNKILTAIYFITAVVFFVIAVIGLVGYNRVLGIIWLCLGSVNLCLGSVSLTKLKKENSDSDDKDKL